MSYKVYVLSKEAVGKDYIELENPFRQIAHVVNKATAETIIEGALNAAFPGQWAKDQLGYCWDSNRDDVPKGGTYRPGRIDEVKHGIIEG